MKRYCLPIHLAFLLTASSSFAAFTPPTVTWTLQVENEQKHYQYTVTNTAFYIDWGPVMVNGFKLYFADNDNGGRSIETHSEPVGWNYSIIFVRGRAIVAWRTSYGMQPGQVAVFHIYTPASVPTAYSSTSGLTNWRWDTFSGTEFGDSFVPVPIPEPSSLLVLAGGMVGLVTTILRRKRI